MTACLSASYIWCILYEFNNATPENTNDPEKTYSSKYYDIEEKHNTEIPLKNKSLSLFQQFPCSLNKNPDDFPHLLSCTNFFFEINKWNKNSKTNISVK